MSKTHHCHFPTPRTSTPPEGTHRRYRCKSIFSSDQRQNNPQQAYLAATGAHALLTAWVVLLHKYTGNETVSFAFISTHQDLNFSSAHGRESSGTEKDIDGNDNVIAGYRVSEHCRLQDVYEVSREQRAAGPWLQDDSVNTAVVFSDRSKALRGRQRNAEGKGSVDGYLEELPWGIGNRVRCSLSFYNSHSVM